MNVLNKVHTNYTSTCNSSKIFMKNCRWEDVWPVTEEHWEDTVIAT